MIIQTSNLERSDAKRFAPRTSQRPIPENRHSGRTGVVLVVVVSLLALFAVIGLGYVIYAESAATASRMSASAQVVGGLSAEIQPELVLNAALSRFLYDSPNDVTGVYSAIRGHSLARSMYSQAQPYLFDVGTGNIVRSYYGIPLAAPPIKQVPSVPSYFLPYISAGQVAVINTNTVPFNGTGRLKYKEGVNPSTGLSIPGWPLPYNLAWDQILNYTPYPNDAIVRNPERYPLDPSQLSHYPTLTTAGNTMQFGSYNQPYTYPDLNNVFLAAVRASDGQVLTPSFHRPSLFGSMDPVLFGTPSQNLNWVKPEGRLMMLRPRPVEQLTQAQCQTNGIPYPITPAYLSVASNQATVMNVTKALSDKGQIFPYPSDIGGDVKNLIGSPGGNDSVWLDLGLPVRITRDGKKYKPLVAFLVRDLDGLVNVNVAGNIRAYNPQLPAANHVVELPPTPQPSAALKIYTNLAHVSNHGLGRHEINVQKVLNPGALRTIAIEYPNLFRGITIGTNPNFTQLATGRHVMGLTSTGALDWSARTTGQVLPSMLNPPVDPNSRKVAGYFDTNDPVQNPANPFPFRPIYFPLDADGARPDAAGNNFRSVPARGFTYQSPVVYPLTLSSFPDAYSPPPVNQAPLNGSNIPSYTGSVGMPPGGASVFGVNPIATSGYDNDSATERTGHPLWFNPMRANGTLYSRLLDAEEMHRLHARFNSPLDWQDSVLSKLMPNTMQSASVRHSITLLSADVGRPGLVPQTVTPLGTGQPTFTSNHAPPNNDGPYAQTGETFMYPFQLYQGPTLNFTNFPFGNAAAAALPNDFQGNVAATFSATGVKSGAGISSNDGRSQVTNFRERLNLNRPLRPYPQRLPGSTVNTVPMTNPPTPVAVNAFPYMSPATLALDIHAADLDRQMFAADIFTTLCMAVGLKGPDGLDAMTNSIPTFNAPLTDVPAYQYLAQIAANIVDDIDEDDIMTRFQWIYKGPTGTLHPEVNLQDASVFGVEMPKVVLNETYIEQTNGDGSVGTYITAPKPGPPPTPSRAIKYRVNVWVELFNTMVPPSTTMSQKNYDELTQSLVSMPAGSPPFSVYQLHLVSSAATVKVPTVGAPLPADSIEPGNPKTLDFAGQPPDKSIIFPVNPSTDPANGAPSSYTSRNIDTVKNEGFLVLGPTPSSNPTYGGAHDLKPAGGGSDLATITSAMLYYEPTAGAPTDPPNMLPPRIVLQRLANPYVAPQPNINAANYNPYVTVDVMDFSTPSATIKPVNVALQYNSSGPVPPTTNTPAPASVVRRQPFAGHISHLAMQMANPPVPGQASHSMFRHNGDQATPPTSLQSGSPPGGVLERFDWLVHHDRKLTTPMELIHVPDAAPWQVTQRFIHDDASPTPNKIRQGHVAPWLDEREIIDPTTGAYGGKIDLVPGTPVASSRLYRALEMFRTADRTVEMAFGGRDIGKVNINTIYDKATFDAICDAVSRRAAVSPTVSIAMTSADLGFTQLDVDYVWDALTNGTTNLTARTPNLNQVGTYSQISSGDMPFWGMGASHASEAWPPPPTPPAQYPPTATGLMSPQYVQNSGINATLFRKLVQPGTPPTYKRSRVFDVEGQFSFNTTPAIPGDPNSTSPPPPVQHPMLEKSLLTKIFEHVTTRSNVFEVYMTVGYFEVKDDTRKPELLGDEIGVIRDGNTGAIVENKAIRHRMFAIIDRTNLTLQPPSFYINSINQAGQPVSWNYSDEDALKQGPSPFYYTSALTPLFPAGSPVSGSSATAIDGVTLGQQYRGLWSIILPITSIGATDTTSPNLPGGSQPRKWASGSYNGVGWVLNALPANMTSGSASVLYLGAGDQQRRVVVRGIVQSPINPEYAIVIVGVPSATPSSNWPQFNTTDLFASPTPRQPVLITNAIAGNPGPQPDFDHKQPNYRGVVLYSVIMD